MLSPIKRFFHSAGKAVLPKIPKWLAKAAGLDLVADMCEVGEDFAKAWLGEAGEAQARAELQAVAQPLPAVQLKQVVDQVVAELAASQPAEVKHGLTQYLLQIPGATRQALKRPADPSGTTVPPALALKSAADVVGLLPVGLTQFQVGERPACLHGDWELLELLGRGGQGEVWKACRTDDADFVAAFKFCTDPDAKRQLQLGHERAIVKRVQTANVKGVASLIDYKLDSSPPWLRYELVDGGDLADFVHQWNEQPDVSRTHLVLPIVQRLARTVGQFHRLPEPVIHRDLKPANILVRRSPSGKTIEGFLIADFGIGHIAARKNLDQSRLATNLGKSLGTLRYACTPLYASPQQQRGDDPDPRDDVFALGVIWYQLALRDLARGAPTGLGWGKKLRAVGLDEGHIQLLGECLAEDPTDRPKDGQALYEQLTHLADEFARRDASATTPLQGLTPAKADLKAPVQPPVEPAKPVKLVTERAKRGQPITNPLGMKFAWVPPGNSFLGGGGGKPGTTPFTLDQGLWCGIYPVTQAEWQQVMGNNPSHFKGHPRFPVETVSYNDVKKLLQELNARVDDYAYRLPTEQEWEYICRGGPIEKELSKYHFYFAKSKTDLTPNPTNDLTDKLANFYHQLRKPSEVGSYLPNALGVYELHGNVWEWTSTVEGSVRVFRGGSWRNPAVDCAAACRFWVARDESSCSLGCRLLAVPRAQ